ncbi:MAG: hypothetical protein DRJ08_03520 [Acidobacteria bacterium]|nr:MAG: hypothetical protein DRJ14_02955 [Acidobacteriota bacterium]RLE22835.1 MAG: hypothetical protein DRJ08_03520 [Acidobacteriota bacterium]
MRDFLAVESFEANRKTLTIMLFMRMELPVTSFTLPVSGPENMLKNLVNRLPEECELSQRMQANLISIFHEAQNSVATGNPPEEEVQLLLTVRFEDGETSTLFQKTDRKIARLKQLLNRLLGDGNPRFVYRVFDMLLSASPDPETLEYYVGFCVKRKETDRLLKWLDFPSTHNGCSMETITNLADIAIYHKQYTEGENLCNLALEQNYGNVAALIGKAQCRYQAGKDDYLVFLQKAFHFNKRITVETVTRRFQFRKDIRVDVFDVLSLKDAMEEVKIPPEALKRRELLSLPYRTESSQGSIYFVREELIAWKKAMDTLSIVSGRFGRG